jgi:hypothetical protein
MKTKKIILFALLSVFFASCSEEKMDEINKEKNDAENMPATFILPDAILKSAFETTGTDIAWYATVYIEHNAGTWAQSVDADKRIAQNASSLFNNNWTNLYAVMLDCRNILDKTDPETGSEAENVWARGIAQVLMAYNLAVTTDMWGDIPYKEALQGANQMRPKYDSQESVYQDVFALLDDAIVNLGNTSVKVAKYDYIYAGDENKWIKTAWALKARYNLRLVNKVSDASARALACIPNAFSSQADAFMFNKYESTATGENPWFQFAVDRTHLSASQTLFNLMNDRNDPRIDAYFTKIGEDYVPAPSGTATQTQGGIYSVSKITELGQKAATPLMTYHELKFIEAEAKFRTNDGTWKNSLKEAIVANFEFHGVAGGEDYYTASVEPRLTAGNELKEIITQKYIGFYEHEAIEAYNDYRRVGYPTMNNPNNSTTGFVNRFPYALSEVSSNGANVPSIDVYTSKVWWAK